MAIVLVIRAMLDKLDGRVPAQDGQTPLPPVQDSTNGPQVRSLEMLEQSSCSSSSSGPWEHGGCAAGIMRQARVIVDI